MFRVDVRFVKGPSTLEVFRGLLGVRAIPRPAAPPAVGPPTVSG